MKIAKAEITDKEIFNKFKTSFNRNSFVECGLCGAVRVEANELARVLHSFIAHVEKGNERLSYLCSDIMEQIIVAAPDDLEGYLEFLQWKEVNERPVYLFLDTDGKTCGYYDDLVIYCDPVCDCFSKDKITNYVIVD
jgi:hypothetical protein